MIKTKWFQPYLFLLYPVRITTHQCPLTANTNFYILSLYLPKVCSYPEFPYNQIALATLLYCRVATATPSGVAVATRQCSVTLFYQVT